MSIELKMPALSPTMEKGTLAKWLVAVGDTVRPGDLLAEIETDKATMEFEAADEGFVAELRVCEGTDDVAVGAVIAVLSAEAPAAPAPAPAPEPARAIQDTAPASTRDAAAAALPPPAERILAPAPRRVQPADRITVSPLAARIAGARGIDLSAINGSGPNGRIVRSDLGLTAPATAFPGAPAPALPDLAPIAPPPGVPVESRRLSTMRRTIAQRLTEAKRNIPHFYLTVRCNIDRLLKLRGELNGGLGDGGLKLSVNDLLMKAMALALVDVPEANVGFGGDVLHQFGRVDLPVAVGIAGGPVTPVIKRADTLSLSAIARESKRLAGKARDGSLTPEDYQGGTASISNLGMFGIDEMVPVINPPQALILGVAAGIEQPWKVDGELALATVMAATASFDHRAIDGATGARFITAFRERVETPWLICV
mgnify:FL=1